MQEVHLVEIYIADMLGLFLILGAIWSGAWKLQKKNKEDRLLLGIMLLIVCACVADAASFTVDNRPGELFRGLSYVSNVVLFFANFHRFLCFL